MHCQIILNMVSVTRWSCSQYSDFLWLINSAATACHWPINQDISTPFLRFFFTCQPIWIWGGAWMASTKRKPLGEHGLAKLFTCVQILIEEYAELSCANGCDNPSHPSQRSFPYLFTHYKMYISSSWFYKSVWIFACNVDTHGLNKLLQNSLANKVARNERLDNVCSSLMMSTNTDRKYQGLTITAHLF